MCRWGLTCPNVISDSKGDTRVEDKYTANSAEAISPAWSIESKSDGELLSLSSSEKASPMMPSASAVRVRALSVSITHSHARGHQLTAKIPPHFIHPTKLVSRKNNIADDNVVGAHLRLDATPSILHSPTTQRSGWCGVILAPNWNRRRS